MLIYGQRLAILIFLFFIIPVKAQQNSIEQLKHSEDSCAYYSKQLINDQPDSTKLLLNTRLTKLLGQSLVVPESFDYPFDSLKTFGRLYAPDKNFRVIT